MPQGRKRRASSGAKVAAGTPDSKKRRASAVVKKSVAPSPFPRKRRESTIVSSIEESHWKGWKIVSLVGTEFDVAREVQGQNWDFDHLEQALSEDGDLGGSNKQVILFGSTEAQSLGTDIHIVPYIVAVVGDIDLPTSVGVKSVQREEEEIIPLEKMRMRWENWNESGEDRCENPSVFYLKCLVRVASQSTYKEDELVKWQYVHPHVFLPQLKDESLSITNTAVTYDPPQEASDKAGSDEKPAQQRAISFTFDFKDDDKDDIVEEVLEDHGLDAAVHKAGVEAAIDKAVESHKSTLRRLRAERQEKIEALKAAGKLEEIQNIKIIKFYPQDKITEAWRAKQVNRYWGHATEVRPPPPPPAPIVFTDAPADAATLANATAAPAS
eukprot:CAMPEP_0177652552 /NCGR_PEP_ID=MMETSP0447-20121125/13197_1 /TAXON_ID=0 /ORGANISM="Stygamoeba regulata, Strain BSH-02190019" /LENGTH=382 /DNA_ID=CAMNT_0019155817 /DNA_START=30 /DNA_END=1178 /DNA_ORIENTATION=+